MIKIPKLSWRNNVPQRLRNRRGAVLLLSTLSLVVVFMAAALLWNWQIMVMIQKDMQNVADISAYSGCDSAMTGVSAPVGNEVRVDNSGNNIKTAIQENITSALSHNIAAGTGIRSGMQQTALKFYYYNNGTLTDNTGTYFLIPAMIELTCQKPKKLIVGDNMTKPTGTGALQLSGKKNGTQPIYEVTTRVRIQYVGGKYVIDFI